MTQESNRYDLVHGLLTWGYPVLTVEPGVEYLASTPPAHYRNSFASNTSTRNDFKRHVRSACEKQN
jgi:hypothetical protein